MDNLDLVLSGQQIGLALYPVKEADIDGVQMGVMNDGSPFLTLRGLARLCAVDHAPLLRFTSNWAEERNKPRGQIVDELLKKQGLNLQNLYTKGIIQGTESNIFPDSVCMAILEYYAFEANHAGRETAQDNFRRLAGSQLRRFIYLSVGIDPDNPQRGALECFHERLLMNDQIPFGYFSVFREMADLSLKMVKGNFDFGPSAIPDISVGTMWSKFWAANELDSKYGPRTKSPHVYPDWFPQHRAGPVEAWIYPDDALGVFRRWMQNDYIPNRLGDYLAKKSADGTLSAVDALRIVEAVKKPELPKPH
ncbi:hypothetical protein RYZ59_22970 [Citrobacter sp. HN-141]|uniref:hypothetical protein n=1 Tax=unclassified Citrobacter TaxID=2644389 RepID=UPI0029016A4B|nr:MULTISPECIES: hypothetical protein [Citrobacter]MDU1875969.1 hypothetical protein [Citrobacter sp.]MDW2646417.1 hypothetical protein [Citrobacter sp. HN-141]MDW2655966.1 hypothetical protein [Citrobacter sp. HN-120]MDW2698992.1 hypothetical protein [Citrobacter sp. HN-144]MEB1078683.1 hypothetical protein [Citrobacter portucalensis]